MWFDDSSISENDFALPDARLSQSAKENKQMLHSDFYLFGEICFWYSGECLVKGYKFLHSRQWFAVETVLQKRQCGLARHCVRVFSLQSQCSASSSGCTVTQLSGQFCCFWSHKPLANYLLFKENSKTCLLSNRNFVAGKNSAESNFGEENSLAKVWTSNDATIVWTKYLTKNVDQQKISDSHWLWLTFHRDQQKTASQYLKPCGKNLENTQPQKRHNLKKQNPTNAQL